MSNTLNAQSQSGPPDPKDTSKSPIVPKQGTGTDSESSPIAKPQVGPPDPKEHPVSPAV